MQMVASSKLSTLGEMAGGIAHDLNNMLTPVLGFAEIAAKNLPQDSSAASMLVEVIKNSRRARASVRRRCLRSGASWRGNVT